MSKIKYTREVLEAAVKMSHSFADLRRNLGVHTASGGTHTHLKRKIQDFGIDISHFRRNWTKEHPPPCKKTPDQILVTRTGEQRAKSDQLRRALIESGVPHVCSKCGLGPEWQGSELVLEVDHIDGNWRNCLKPNLRFLCPNCHSQTQNVSPGKCVCGKAISRRSVRCRECHLRHILPLREVKGDWPTPAELAVLIWKKPATSLAEDIGVSSSRLKQRCKDWGISTPPRGYWSKKSV